MLHSSPVAPGAVGELCRDAQCYSLSVVDIPARELRNDVRAVLRRVEAGERLRVTSSGRPVAERGELRPGVLAAESASMRARRLETLSAAEALDAATAIGLEVIRV